MTAKDLTVGKEYLLDDTKQVSGVCLQVGERDVAFDPVPNQPQRYVKDSKGRILFPVNVPYQYQEVEA